MIVSYEGSFGILKRQVVLYFLHVRVCLCWFTFLAISATTSPTIAGCKLTVLKISTNRAILSNSSLVTCSFL